MKASTQFKRAGFTLVEILVVIAIIGILAAILVPTLAVAIKNVRESAILYEVNQLEMAMEQYAKDNGGSYPPDFTLGINPDDPNRRTSDTGIQSLVDRLNLHLRKISPNHQEEIERHLDSTLANAIKNSNGETFFDRQHHEPDPADPKPPGPSDPEFENVAPDGIPDITPDEALVFWLSGTTKNAAFPISSAGDPEAGTGDRRVYFEFNAAQLKDFDGDGFPSYVPKYGPEVPYVYFHHSTYAIAAYQPNLNIVDTGENDLTPSRGVITQARPYAVPLAVKDPGETDPDLMVDMGTWVEEDRFQIVTAGYDGDYGEYPLAYSLTAGTPRNLSRRDTTNGVVLDPDNVLQVRKYFPNGRNFLNRRDLDNLASFAERRLDKDID